MVDTTTTPQAGAAAFRELVPNGMLRLVDNRIFAGESTEFTQPMTVMVLAPKHLKEENIERVKAMIEVVNTALWLYDLEVEHKASLLN